MLPLGKLIAQVGSEYMNQKLESRWHLTLVGANLDLVQFQTSTATDAI
jgi:hypothetical protein